MYTFRVFDELRRLDRERIFASKAESIDGDPILQKLWKLSFTHNPCDPRFPLEEKSKEAQSVTSEDIKHLFRRSPSLAISVLRWNVIPMYFALEEVSRNPHMFFPKVWQDLTETTYSEWMALCSYRCAHPFWTPPSGLLSLLVECPRKL